MNCEEVLNSIISRSLTKLQFLQSCYVRFLISTGFCLRRTTFLECRKCDGFIQTTCCDWIENVNNHSSLKPEQQNRDILLQVARIYCRKQSKLYSQRLQAQSRSCCCLLCIQHSRRLFWWCQFISGHAEQFSLDHWLENLFVRNAVWYRPAISQFCRSEQSGWLQVDAKWITENFSILPTRCWLVFRSFSVNFFHRFWFKVN